MSKFQKKAAVMENSTLRETPLKSVHISLGAKMVPFAGWEMPVQYGDGIIAEHRRTREAASLFDICHMGEFEVDGPGAAEELDRLLARPVADQKIGSCRYNFLLNDQGGVMDDLIVYRIDQECFFLVVNAATIASDAEQISKNLSGDVEFDDLSDNTGKLDLQGPDSARILEKLGIDASMLPAYYHWTEVEIAGIPCLMSRTGYTGELGFEFYVDAEQVELLWNALLENGACPAGLGARDTLRLEMGYPLYGHEMDAATTPVEAGFGKMLKLEELPERDFIGSAALRAGTSSKTLVGIKLDGRRAAREHTEVYSDSGELIGQVSSGAFSPSLECAIALAYINNGAISAPGTKVLLNVGKNMLEGSIVPLPFYPGGTARIKL